MTTPAPQYPGAGPQHPVSPPPVYTGDFGFAPPQPRPRKRLWLVLGAAVALLVVIAAVIAGALLASGDKQAAAPKAVSAWDQEQSAQGSGPAGEDLPDPATTTAGPRLVADDVKLVVKVTDKQCFGSAGCSVEFKLNAGWAPTLSADETWLVTYQVTGIEDGPLIGSFEITGDSYTVPEEFVQTTSSKAKIKVKVTDVEKVGI